MRKGQINHFFILLHILTEGCFPVSFRTLFPVIFENGDERWRIPGRNMSHREQTPLAATLKFIKKGVDHFYEIKLADISTFCYTKIGHYSIFIVSFSSTAYSGIGSIYYSLATIIWCILCGMRCILIILHQI